MKSPLVPAKSNIAMGDANTWWLDVKDDEFVHFTTASRADRIVTMGKMLLKPEGVRQFGAPGVHGISTVYGRYVPRTQVTHIDATPTDPTVAVVFRTKTTPKIGFVEEVVWDHDVSLTSVRIVPMARGVAMIGSAPAVITENDIVVYTADQRPFLTSYTPAQLDVLRRLLDASDGEYDGLIDVADRLRIPPELVADKARIESTLKQFGVKVAADKASDFAAAFFQRHPHLRSFKPRFVLDGARSIANPRHPEARQKGDDVLLYSKFWGLSPDVQDFVFAHELGHFALSRHGLPALIEVLKANGVDAWDTSSLPFGQHNMEEAFADAFASLATDKDVERRYPAWAETVRKITKLGSTVQPSGTTTAERVWRRFAKEISLGTVGVDSGTIMLLDPAYADDWGTGKHPELSYDSVTDHSWSGSRQLHFAPGTGAGVLVKTQYGDGSYPVTAEVDDEGHVESVTVRFTSDERAVTAAKPRYKGKKETEAGNTVYMYSERQIANRNKGKAKRLEKLRSKIGDVRKQVSKDLKSDDPETFLTALAVALIDETYERVGNSESADESGHFGVTGWQRGHVSFSKGKATIRYTGKAGVKHEKTVDNGSVVKALRDAYEGVEGDEACLFAPEGMTIDARKVNAYLKQFDITAKDLRGFHANRAMQDNLKAERKAGGKLPTDKKEREKKLKDEFKKALEETAEDVGHEAATLKNQYLVPGLEEAFLENGTVPTSMDKTASVLLRYLDVTN